MSRPPGPAHDRAKADALSNLDLVKVMRSYVASMIDAPQGYKGLVLDKETMRICSMLFGRSELADHNVVHIEALDASDGRPHEELKAVCFMRPTRDNIALLKRELKQPRFQSYHIFFSNLVNSVSHMFLQDLAEGDAAKERVQEVQEYYGDFVALDPHHFMVPVLRNELLYAGVMPPGRWPAVAPAAAEYELIDRCVQGLSALFLALRRRPVVRYQRGSDIGRKLADSLYRLIYTQEAQVFDFGSRGSPPLVLLLDRKDDPVTPLLTQWTYQAMVHELVGINDNTCKLTNPKVPKDFKEIVLDARQDDFYRRHLYSNYGEVGVSVRQLMDQFQSTQQKHAKVESLEDMQRFVMQHVDFQRLQGNVSKHVNLMTELSEAVGSRNLMELSMAEQEVANPAANLTAAASFEDIMKLVRQNTTSDRDRVRLVMLYALRFEADSQRVRQLQDYLVTAGVRDREPGLFAAIDAVLRYAGASKRAGDLYGSRNLLSKAFNAFKGLQGVENLYTQHTPLLTETLTQLLQDKLDIAAYPYWAATADEAAMLQARRAPPKEVIVFILGGSTYEEAKAVAEWNERNPGMRVVLGGTALLNSESFLAALMANLPPDVVSPPRPPADAVALNISSQA